MMELPYLNYEKIIVVSTFLVGCFIAIKALSSMVSSLWIRKLTWKSAGRTSAVVALGLAIMILPMVWSIANDSVYIAPMPVSKPGDPVF